MVRARRMAQWHELLRLDSALQRRVSQLYEGRFPREIRHWLCSVIESQDWDLAAQDETTASTCFRTLLLHLEEHWNNSAQENNILQGPDFIGMRDILLIIFQNKPLNLAITLSECLKAEKEILDSASLPQAPSSPTVDQTWRQLDSQVNELKTQNQEIKNRNKSLGALYEELDFIDETWRVQVEQQFRLTQVLSSITETKQVLLQQMSDILKLAEEIVVTLTDVELPQWKRRQQMACLGSPVDVCLDHLQKWFTEVAEVLLEVRQQLQRLKDQNKKHNGTDAPDPSGRVAQIEKVALSLCTKLLTNALVVEKQPVISSLPQRPLILKTKVGFTVSVRFLANLPKLKDQLKVKPAFDKDVEEAQTIKGFRHFELKRNNFKVLDEDTPDGGLVAEFGHMSLEERKSRVRGSSENRLVVTEELHIIKFVMEFEHAGLEFNIEASTLPVVVISSTNQAASAWASVMWCNTLSTSEPRNLSLFVDPPPLTWTQLSQVLSWQFLSVGQRELDENQLEDLKEKIVDDPNELVSWTTFSKNESVWIWIDGILDLIKKYLVDLWRDGCIMGFVNKNRTQALLQEKQTGTFLLRFSESNKEGAITFSWVEHSNGERNIRAVNPYTKQELSSMCLADIIFLYSLRTQRNTTSNPLLYLYPDTPKDAAFGRYYTDSATKAFDKTVNGYIIRVNIPVSVFPTPPPSPPGESPPMEIDDICQQPLPELFPELLDFCQHSDFF